MAIASANLLVAEIRPHVLIIEEEGIWKNVLAPHLQGAGYDTTIVPDRFDGVRRAQALRPDFILLDLRSPSGDVCRKLREDESTREIPILRLVVKGDQAEPLATCVFAADDPVIKPVTVRALIQRLKVLQRSRVGLDVQTRSLECNGIRIDYRSHHVYVKEMEVHLTPTEFRLLECFLRSPGRALSRTQLADGAIGQGVLVLERTIDVHVKALRKKLGRAAILVETVRMIGYRFRDTASAGSPARDRYRDPRSS